MTCSLSMRGSFVLRALFFSVAVLLLAPASAVDKASSETTALGDASVKKEAVISEGEAPAQAVEPTDETKATSDQIAQTTAAPAAKSETLVGKEAPKREEESEARPQASPKVEEETERAKLAAKKEEPPKVLKVEEKMESAKPAVKKVEPPTVARKLDVVVPTDTHKGKTLEAHLDSLENARKVGLQSSKVEKLASEAQRLAKEYLSLVANGPIDEFETHWSHGTNLAKRAGVAREDVDEIFKTLKTKLHDLYVDTVAKIVKTSFNSTEKLQELVQIAKLSHIWRKLQVLDDDPDVKAAKALLRDVVKEAFEKGDIAFTRKALNLAKSSKADLQDVKEEWLELYEAVENMYPEMEKHPLKDLVSIVNRAAKAKLPKTEHLKKIESSCQNKTLDKLRHLEGKSIREILELIKDAREADVSPSSYALSSAEAHTRTMAIAGIDKLIHANASLTEKDVDSINNAFQVAWETGVDSTIVAEKSAALQKKALSKLQSATGLLSSNRTVARMKTLADLLRVWRDLTSSLPKPDPETQEVPNKARDVFTKQLEAAIDKMEMTYVVEGGRLVDYAHVKCCQQARQWAESDGMIEGLVKQIRDGHDVNEAYLLRVVTDAKACHYPSTKELQEIKHRLSVVSQDKLSKLLSGDTNIQTIVDALVHFKQQRRAVSGSEANRTSAEIAAEKRVRDFLNKTLVESHQLEDGTILSIALEHAKRVELPAAEIKEAWKRVTKELHSKLSSITTAAEASATSTRSSIVGASGSIAVDYSALGVKLEELTKVLLMWRKLSLPDDDQVKNARAALERHIKAGFAARDPDFIVSSLQWMSTSKHIFQEGKEIQDWAKTYRHVKEVCDAGLENHKMATLLELRENARKQGILEVGHGATLDTFLKNAVDAEMSNFA